MSPIFISFHTAAKEALTIDQFPTSGSCKAADKPDRHSRRSLLELDDNDDYGDEDDYEDEDDEDDEEDYDIEEDPCYKVCSASKTQVLSRARVRMRKCMLTTVFRLGKWVVNTLSNHQLPFVHRSLTFRAC